MSVELNLVACPKGKRFPAFGRSKIPSWLWIFLCRMMIAGLATRLLSGCAYFGQRGSDALDMFYVAGGPGLGLQASASASALTVSGGSSVSNLSGWEGRRLLHRFESSGGFPPICSICQQVDTSQTSRITFPPWDNMIDLFLKAGIDPAKPLECMSQGQFGIFALAPCDPTVFMRHLDLETTYLKPVVGRVYGIPDWGFGFGATAGVVSARIGMRPTGAINFATGWLGFHLLPPYEFFSNRLSNTALLKRGVVAPDAAEHPVETLLALMDAKNAGFRTRRNALKVLGFLGEKARPAIPALLKIRNSEVQDEGYTDLEERIQAALALSRIDLQQYPAEPQLFRMKEAYLAKVAKSGTHEDKEEQCWYADKIEKVLAILSKESGPGN
jgi:hypothetical protein